MVTLVLNRNRHRCFEGHPWVFRSEIERLDGDPVAGDVIEIIDGRGRAFGWGLWSPASQIAVRIMGHSRPILDATAWSTRLQRAIAYRDHLGTRSCRRLVHSEADHLPGLIVDQYGDRLVFQLTTAAVDAHRSAIIDLLNTVPGINTLIERSDISVRKKEGLPPHVEVIRGDATPRLEQIGAVRIPVDPMDPHKTGGYLDQQDNYQIVANFVQPQARVLDVFCHLGGFALHAAHAGASQVVAIDSSEASCDGAQAAAEDNGYDDRIQVVCDNAFDDLRGRSADNERFDVIILDPPSFARGKDSIDGALRGYKELHLRALHMLPMDGVMATFSCSHHIDAKAYEANILQAATDARVTVRRETILSAAADHPVLPAVPETEYLKGGIYRVIDRW